MNTYEKLFPNDDKYRKRFTDEASKFYINKMLELIDGDATRMGELSGFVPGLKLPNHLMYRVDENLVNKDNIRSYEFLIEYNIKKPSEGIYYGCRGITKEGANHDHMIKLFRQDWDNIKGLLCQVLNNIFPEKDFSRRFKMTDNANTNTYWLFWISLYEDEDIKKVGVVATKKIKEVFDLYLEGKAGEPLVLPSSKQITPKTVFCESSYQELLKKVKNRDIFELLLQRFEDEGWIERSPLYEHAWIFKGVEKLKEIIDFVQIIDILKKKGYFNKGIPWEALENVFLQSDGNAFKNLKQNNYSRMKNGYIAEKDWQKKIEEILPN